MQKSSLVITRGGEEETSFGFFGGRGSGLLEREWEILYLV
jgi:hypothetical protein